MTLIEALNSSVCKSEYFHDAYDGIFDWPYVRCSAAISVFSRIEDFIRPSALQSICNSQLEVTLNSRLIPCFIA